MQEGPYAETIATNLRVLAALHRALDVLSGLPVVVFKGPIWTLRAYGQLGARASADCDLWLPAHAALEALQRLLEAGYAPSGPIDPQDALRFRGQVALWPARDPSGVSIDLHQRPFARPYFDVEEAVLLEHLETDLSSGRAVQTFDLGLSFCHAVAHYVQHHFEDQRLDMVRRLWLLCIGAEGMDGRGPLELSAADPGLLELVERTCGRPAAALALHRAADSSRQPLPSAAGGRRARDVARILASFEGIPPGVARKFLALYLTAPGRLLPGIWGSAFPPSSYLEEQYGPGSRPWLLVRHAMRVLSER